MNIKKTLFAAVLALGCMSASAQEAKTEYVFNPHWYVQGQVGAQYTLGEISFGDLVSPNAQVALGYQFDKVFGVRLAVNAWQSKAGSEFNAYNGHAAQTYKWDWKYVSPNLDLTVNLSNLLAGYNPERVVSVGVFAGIGANIAFSNDKAADADKAIRARYIQDSQFLEHVWSGTALNLNGQAGANVDFRLSDAVSLGIELQANFMNDHYNSKHATNADWTFNALAGIKYNFGKTYEKKEIPAPAPVIEYRDRVVEKIVEKIVEKPVEVVKKEPLRIDVFFTIASTKVMGSEAQKIAELANYLKKNPEAKATITGYADKGTGNAKINRSLSEKRAAIVAETLQKKYGIPADRIITDAKGDTVQPFDVEVLNRVSICIAE